MVLNILNLKLTAVFLLPGINEIKFSKNYILIFNRSLNKVYLFNRNGKFVSQISGIGKGPGEYIEASKIAISEDEKSFYVRSYNREIISNNVDGEHLNTFIVEPYGRALFCWGNNIIIHSDHPMSILNDDYNFTAYSETGKLIKRFSQRKISWGKEGDTGAWYSKYRLNDTINVWDYYYDTIFGVSQDFKVTPRWIIKHDNNYVDKKDFSRGRVFSNFFAGSKKNMLTSILETENFFFLTMDQEINEYSILYNKSLKSVIIPGQNSNYLRGYGFINDLDGGFPFWPTGIIDKNTVYAIVTPEVLKSYKNNLPLTNKINIKYPDLNSKFESMVSKLKENNNPIIIKVHLK